MDLRPESKKTSSPSEVENVYSLFKDFHIEKKSIKSKIVNNPFNNKFLKKRKRKIAINYSLPQCKEILAELKITKPTQNIEQKESKLITDITERMAKVWNENGYRELELKHLIAKDNTNLPKSNNKSTSCECLQEESTDTHDHPQVSNQTCARQALYDYCDSSVTELAAYLDETLFIPRKMSFMAEMMYT